MTICRRPGLPRSTGVSRVAEEHGVSRVAEEQGVSGVAEEQGGSKTLGNAPVVL